MRNYILFLSLLCTSTFVDAQGPTWDWAMAAGGNNVAQGTKVAVDAQGNVYQTGWYSCSTITFGDSTLISPMPSGNDRIYLAKYTAQGQLLWIRQPEWYASGRGMALAVDGDGNVLLGGSFKGNEIKFGTILRYGSSTNNDLFVTKYDSAGNVLWVRVAGSGSVGGGADFVTDLCTDATGNVFFSGGSNSASVVLGSITLNNYGADLSFLVKLDTMGTVLWARGSQSSCSHSSTCVTADAAGNVYMGGWFFGIPHGYGGGIATTAATGLDAYLFRFSPGGQPQWVRKVSGNSDEEFKDLCIDPSGKLYAVGTSKSAWVDFGSGAQPFPGLYYRAFLAQYDTSGTVNWARVLSDSVRVYDMAFDAMGNTYMAGSFECAQMIAGSDTLSNTGIVNTYVLAHDAGGTPLWAAHMGGERVYAYGIALDGSGGVYITGSFGYGDAYCDTLTLVQAVPGWITNTFLARLQAPNISTGVPAEVLPSMALYPNPTSGVLRYSPAPATPTSYTVFDAAGHVVLSGTMQGGELDVRTLPWGLYALRIDPPGRPAVVRFVKE